MPELHPPDRSARRRAAAAALVAGTALAALAGACSSSADPEAAAPTSGPTLPGDLALAPTTTAPDDPASPPDSGHGGVLPPPTVPGAAGTLRFEVVAPLSCEGPSFEAEARWEGFEATRAVLLVDNVQVAGDVAPSGPHALDLPCDGRAHTVILYVQAADGTERMGTKAVLSTPEG